MEGGNMSKKYEQPTDFADAKKKLAEARRGRTIAENKLAALAEEKLALTELETDSFRSPAPASPPTPSKIIRSPNFQGWFSRGWQRFRGKSVTDIPPEEVKK
jgi:hypothetical protein